MAIIYTHTFILCLCLFIPNYVNYFIILKILIYYNNLENPVEGNTLNLKTKKELKDKPPSSPEDGEITEDEDRSDNNDEKVRLIRI